jgi:hypothetical protein
VSESDLTSNEFFKKHFSADSQQIVLPFAFSERFINQKSVRERINKCVAVGTVLRVDKHDYRNFFGPQNLILQPMRKVIFDNAHLHSDIFLNIMRDPEQLKVGSREGILTAELNETEVENAYYKISVVDLFHTHAMFISPEELIGLPSSNFVDGMASGCVYVGADLPMYEKFGMLAGVHFIAYEEHNFESMLDKIRYYQNNPDELKKISIAGKDFAFSHFSPESIRSKFKSDIDELLLKFNLLTEKPDI